jgi:hypothetical protein
MTEDEEELVDLYIKIKVTFLCSLSNEAKTTVDLTIPVEHNRFPTG